jgi:hypothetical protein
LSEPRPLTPEEVQLKEQCERLTAELLRTLTELPKALTDLVSIPQRVRTRAEALLALLKHLRAAERDPAIQREPDLVEWIRRLIAVLESSPLGRVDQVLPVRALSTRAIAARKRKDPWGALKHHASELKRKGIPTRDILKQLRPAILVQARAQASTPAGTDAIAQRVLERIRRSLYPRYPRR